MSWSLGECRALALKATRGAGASWGIAEEAGFAVHWLERNGLPGIQALARYLQSDGISECNAGSSIRCPLHFGASVSDHGSLQAQEPFEVFQPLLMVPFLSLCSKTKDMVVGWAGAEIFLRQDRCKSSSDTENLLADRGSVSTRFINQTFQPNPQKTRVGSDSQSAMDVLNQFAHRTYAPSTEESRLKGAG